MLSLERISFPIFPETFLFGKFILKLPRSVILRNKFFQRVDVWKFYSNSWIYTTVPLSIFMRKCVTVKGSVPEPEQRTQILE